ncbi:MAG: DUF2189 domain-containing protein [Steroidobacteraceae bacterium]
MRRFWGASLAFGLLIVAIGWTLLVFCGTHPLFIAAAVSGFMLVGPLMSAGVCEMSRRCSLDQPPPFAAPADGVGRNNPALLEFGAILATFALVWFAMSAIMLNTVFHVSAAGMPARLYEGFFAYANRPQVLAYITVGGVLAIAVFLLSAVAVPLIIDRQATAAQAMRTSIKAVVANLPAMTLWGALIVGLTLLGFVPLLAGLVIVAPLLGHATWHAYKDVIR